MPADIRSCMIVLASISFIVLSGCISTKPQTTPDLTPTTGCERSVTGDIATAQRHLERGRPETALHYIEGLKSCLEAQTSLAYLQTAMDAFHSAGQLNPAWVHWQRAYGRASELRDNKSVVALEGWATAFRSSYVMLEFAKSARLPKISYDGPFADEATLRQVQAITQGSGFSIDSERIGFWLLPGRYRVGESVEQLAAGTVYREGT